MPSDDDRTLLARFAAGDPAAFAPLVDRHGPLVWGVCRRGTPNEALAEDAFQAVFVVLARKAKSLTLRTSLANWLFGVACRVAKRAARREIRVKQLEREAIARRPRHAAVESDRGGPEWDDVLRVLDEELGRLPDRHRGPLVACYLQGKTQDEAAAELGWTVFTLRRRLAEARDVLRACLTRRGATLATALFAGAIFAATGFAAPPPPAVVQAATAMATTGSVPPAVAALAAGTGLSVAVKAGLVAVGLIGATAGGAALFTHVPRPVDQPAPAIVEPPLSSSADPVVYDWVTVRGRVLWPGDPPKPVPLAVDGPDAVACCGGRVLLSNELIVNPTTRGVKNVVVWLRPDDDDPNPTFPPQLIHPALRDDPPARHVLDQPDCQFEPRVLAARDGDTLLVRNSAAIRHNVNCTGCGLEYNLTLEASKDVLKGPLRADRLPVPIKCDLHPWMKAWLRVFDHPYFAVTDADGRFEIEKAPAGRWRVVYWHERGFHRGKDGRLGFPLTVPTTRPTLALEAVEIALP
jgi:RNA polymerase sigma factor (sigma-70 family)